MKEKNYDRLRRALDRLPDYDANAEQWDSLARKLEGGEQAKSSLSERLPSYAPPTTVWNQLNHEMDQHKALAPTRLRAAYVRIAAVAATLLILAFAGPRIYDNFRGPKISYAYSQEANPAPVVPDWDDEASSFERIRQAVAERDEPILNSLGHELDELTAAREEVKAMLVAYGEDPQVIRQLAEIERERDDVYRRINVEL